MSTPNKDLPDRLITQINEQTAGGFILFYVNRNGEPDWLVSVDNNVIGRGLVSYVEDTIESIREIQKVRRITMLNGPDEDE